MHVKSEERDKMRKRSKLEEERKRKGDVGCVRHKTKELGWWVLWERERERERESRKERGAMSHMGIEVSNHELWIFYKINGPNWVYIYHFIYISHFIFIYFYYLIIVKYHFVQVILGWFDSNLLSFSILILF